MKMVSILDACAEVPLHVHNHLFLRTNDLRENSMNL